MHDLRRNGRSRKRLSDAAPLEAGLAWVFCREGGGAGSLAVEASDADGIGIGPLPRSVAESGSAYPSSSEMPALLLTLAQIAAKSPTNLAYSAGVIGLSSGSSTTSLKRS